MGQVVAKPGTRRRLTKERGEFQFRNRLEGDGIIFKPFGKWDYGYETDMITYLSWLQFIVTSWATFSIDYLEAAAILGIAVYLQEHPEWWPKAHQGGTGASYIYNVQGGYIRYHYFIKGRRDLSTWLGAWSTVLTDIAGVGDFGWLSMETSEEYRQSVHHWVHMVGVTEGMSVAFLLDFLRPKKGNGRGWLFLIIPFITLGIMYMDRIET